MILVTVPFLPQLLWTPSCCHDGCAQLLSDLIHVMRICIQLPTNVLLDVKLTCGILFWTKYRTNHITPALSI